MKKTQQLISQVCVRTRSWRTAGQEMSGSTVASTFSTLHRSTPLRLLLGSAWISNRCTANRTNSHPIPSHPLPNPTFTYQLSSPSKAARRLSLRLCLLNLLGRTLMFHYGHQSSCLLTITDDETDAGHAVTDNGVQGSFCLWFPAELFSGPFAVPCTCF